MKEENVLANMNNKTRISSRLFPSIKVANDIYYIALEKHTIKLVRRARNPRNTQLNQFLANNVWKSHRKCSLFVLSLTSKFVESQWLLDTSLDTRNICNIFSSYDPCHEAALAAIFSAFKHAVCNINENISQKDKDNMIVIC